MDPRTAFEALLAVAGFLSAFWIRAMREEIRDLIRNVADHGARIAVLESQVRDLKGGRNG